MSNAKRRRPEPVLPRFPTCLELDGVLFYATGKVGHRARGLEVHELQAAAGSPDPGARVWASATGEVYPE